MKNCKILLRFLTFAARLDRGLFSFFIASRIIKSIMPFAILIVGKHVIDEVIFSISHKSLQLQASTYRYIYILLLIELFLVGLSEFTTRLSSFAEVTLSEKIQLSMSEILFQKISEIELIELERSSTQDEFERARFQIAARGALLSQIGEQVQNIISFISLIIGVFIISPLLTGLIILSTIPVLMAESYFNKRFYDVDNALIDKRRELDYIRTLGTSVTNAKEIKVYRLSNTFIKRFVLLSSTIQIAHKVISKRRAYVGILLGSLAISAYYFSYFRLLDSTINGVISVGSLVYLIGSFRQIRSFCESIFVSFSTVSIHSYYLKDYYSIIDKKYSKAVSHRKFPKEICIGFEFVNLSFKFENSEKYIFRNMNLKIFPKSTTAIIGANGSGKSTLINLMLGLYKPSEGEILFEGFPLSTYCLDELYENVGVIFQDFIKYSLSINDNITAKGSSIFSQTKVIEASKLGGAYNFVSNFDFGYSQMLGKLFSNGVNLSGGEWQKIALSRAHLDKPPILIFDEPSAALDQKSEHDFFERFYCAASDIRICITHKVDMISKADTIVMLDKGEIVGLGNHDSLMLTCELYKSLTRSSTAMHK